MKNITLKTLLITLTIGSAIQAGTALRALVTTGAMLTGAKAGYHATNDITNSIHKNDYSMAAQEISCVALGGALIARTGTYMGIYADILKVCIPPMPGSINPEWIASYAHKTANATGTLARSMRFGSRAMFAASLATAGYQYAYPTLKNIHVTFAPVKNQSTH